MRFRLPHRTAGVALIFAAGIALPACDKKKDGSDSKGPPPDAYKGQQGYQQGSKGGPPGGMPMPGGGTPGTGQPNDPTLPSPPVGAPHLRTADATTRLTGVKNLHQIGVAFNNSAAVYNGFPTGIADKTGKIGLSWRVAILPFIEQDALYKQFKLDEPWDSEHNKKLIDKMPQIYGVPGVSTNGYTYYRSFSGPDAVMPPVNRPLTAKETVIGVKLTDITDGLATTLLVAEAEQPVIWTKPDELLFATGKPLPKLGGGVYGEGFNALFCDSSVRFFKNTIDTTTLGSLIHIRDGSIVKLD